MFFSRKVLCGFGKSVYSDAYLIWRRVRRSAATVGASRETRDRAPFRHHFFVGSSIVFQRYVFSTLTMISPDMVCPRTGSKYVGKKSLYDRPYPKPVRRFLEKTP